MDREFLISQYADGTISDADRACLDAAMAHDAELRELLSGEEAFTKFLRNTSAPLPVVQWETLSKHISSAVAEADEPVTSYRLFPLRLNGLMALAASLLIASTIGFGFYLSSRDAGTSTIPIALAKPQVLLVTGPVAEASANAVSEITIGPPANANPQSNLAQYSEDLVTRQARVVIASGINPPSEPASSLPY